MRSASAGTRAVLPVDWIGAAFGGVAAMLAAVLLLVLVGGAAPAPAYDRNAGHLPQRKAEADAKRLGDVIQRFQQRRMQGKCVSLQAKHGFETLWYLVNEEGRGFFPPRAGSERELFRLMKDAIARGERLEPERVLELGLEANLRGGEVNLQNTFLSIHNVVRLMARPETWWSDSSYARGLLIWTPGGDFELTKGRWEPGWRGMEVDSIFPLVRDIVGDQAVEGEGHRTLAEIRDNAWSQQPEEKQREHERNRAEARAKKEVRIEALRAEIDRRGAEKQRLEAEAKAALQAVGRAGGGGAARAAGLRVAALRRAISALDAAMAEVRAAIQRLVLEVSLDITGNAVSQAYTRDLFDTDSGVFSSLYGAEEQLGNGGNWYYFWLGAVTWSAKGTAAETFGTKYEAAQKWRGSEEEYARGLVQLSHFGGGAELARQAWTRFETCGGWQLVETWSGSYSSRASGAPYSGSATAANRQATVRSSHGSSAHSWGEPAAKVAGGGQLEIELSADASSLGSGRAYTGAYVARAADGEGGFGIEVMVPSIMDWAGIDSDEQNAVLNKKPVFFRPPSKGERLQAALVEIAMVKAAGQASAKATVTLPADGGEPVIFAVCAQHSSRVSAEGLKSNVNQTMTTAVTTYYRYEWRGPAKPK